MWYVQWAKSPVIEAKEEEEGEEGEEEVKESCRGCHMDFAGKRYGEGSSLARVRFLCNAVRKTEAGVYCAECFTHLPPCPVCGVEPTSHAEYPCVKCELLGAGAEYLASGGRESSPTFRGWSTVYNRKGQDNGYGRRKYAKD